MITDFQTTTLYINRNLLKSADTKEFGTGFIRILKENGITPKFIEYPKYFWCRDYLPVQISEYKFVQFRFDPDYLYPDEKIPLKTIQKLHQDLELSVTDSDLVIDGGNVIKGPNKVILTDKIYRDNKKYKKDEIIQKLGKLFDDTEVIFIPAIPGEVTGHSDGIVRIIDDSNVMVSDFSKIKRYQKFNDDLLGVLGKYFNEIIPVPYFELDRKNKNGDYPAHGCYINYLQIGNKMFLPTFDHDMDAEAIKCFESHFDEVIPVPSSGLSEWGGVLNCVSWNIIE